VRRPTRHVLVIASPPSRTAAAAAVDNNAFDRLTTINISDD